MEKKWWSIQTQQVQHQRAARAGSSHHHGLRLTPHACAYASIGDAV